MTNPEALLPPGFRFHPTDEELILYYLRNQATSLPCPVSIIAEVDIYKFDPWDLPGKAMFGDREWYFFSPRDRKYPNGVRPNRAAASGYWKATGTDKPIVTSGPRKENIGVKKALVFYRGKPPKGVKTKWIMHEYRLAERPDSTHSRPMNHRDSMRLDDWVLCRIYKKSNNPSISSSDGDYEDTNSEDAYLPPGPGGGGRSQNDVKLPKSSSLSQLLDDADWSRLLYENPSEGVTPELGSHLGQANNMNHLSFLHGGGNIAVSFSSPLRPAPMETPSSFVIGNSLRRQRTTWDFTEDPGNPLLPPTKKQSSPYTPNYSINLANPAAVDSNTSPQCDVLGQNFLQQQMLLNPHLGLQ
ncbi:hypothetical protein Taro_054228 [Colocasia esculenta]|uniref:NAC domain-containing protein n=1 Tax=Colocasia esculenta TaxID=4460 RepID=A0A843XQG6_COLES|nr:hypothetical protein [Colocasia esculenta]